MNTRGNVFIIIVSILAVIFTTATFFMKGTIEEKHQTEFSQRDAQTLCLAEAALERALGVLNRQLNASDQWKIPDSLANRIRRPLTKGTASNPGKAELGNNPVLDLGDTGTKITLKKTDLEGANGTELTDLVDFMVGKGSGAQFDVTVDLSIERAYSIGPGPSVEGDKYKVPGVEIHWNCHSAVTEFLKNNGYVALTLALPPGMKWLEFSIPISVGGFEIYRIDVISLLEKVIPAIQQYTQYTEMDVLLSTLFPNFYPYKITLNKDIFPALSDKIGGVTVPSDIDSKVAVEKYGYLKIDTKATITYPDKKVHTKTINASKEFKCADVEPPASLYSFFISNLADEKITFDDIGGNLFINNFAGYGAIKDGPPAGAEEKREFPGLVRVNGTSQMRCNVGFIGDPSSPNIDKNDSLFKKMGRGMEWLLMIDLGCWYTPLSSEKSLSFKADWAKYPGTTGTTVPDSCKGAGTGQGKGEGSGADLNKSRDSAGDASIARSEGKNVTEGGQDTGAVKNFLSGLLSSTRLNIIPPTSFGVTFADIALHRISGLVDRYANWEWPMMGTDGWISIPWPTPSATVTHFFGFGALFPTLTREVEGFVLKAYRQWHFGMISYPLGPFPAGNQIYIPGIPFLILPVPLPDLHRHDIFNKYDYNLWTLKSPKDNNGEVDTEVHAYDPSIQENSPPNLYSVEQYAKKATFYYSTAEDFYADLPNRLTKENGKDCLKLQGITFIADSVRLPPQGSETLYISGRGAIVTGGNFLLGGDIVDAWDKDEDERKPETPRTVFSLIARKGGMIFDSSGPTLARIEGSVYTDKGIAVTSGRALTIVGNWITNAFSKAFTMGEIVVEYNAYKTRSSLNSIHPQTGVYDPERYFVTLAPDWDSWKSQ